jgi:hypothetical protein
MENKIIKIVGWFLFIMGFLFMLLTILSLFFELDFWDKKETSFYLIRLIFIFVFIMTPMISGSILLSIDKRSK